MEWSEEEKNWAKKSANNGKTLTWYYFILPARLAESSVCVQRNDEKQPLCPPPMYIYTTSTMMMMAHDEAFIKNSCHIFVAVVENTFI